MFVKLMTRYKLLLYQRCPTNPYTEIHFLEPCSWLKLHTDIILNMFKSKQKTRVNFFFLIDDN